MNFPEIPDCSFLDSVLRKFDIIKDMKRLSETNPHLQDKEQAKRLNARSTRTSCGVEGIKAKDKGLTLTIDHSRSNAVLEEMEKRLHKS
ncbi:hypothetical protein [Legionella rowbothamii]|uniref:hypothetical protein n=1 Tax=Legionella rowbothamii TaxID=96229 RepID=UPI001055A3D2|nr:hypothetical protein [Legionella rowbothamii]